MYIDASSWTDWYYIDLGFVARNKAMNAGFDASSAFVRYPIPTDSIPHSDIAAEGKAPGIYTYWYDVFGSGLANHEFRHFQPTQSQPEPPSWSIAIHRNNVRTNGGRVFETDYESMDELPESSKAFRNADFQADTWNETDVWVTQTEMMNGMIGNQGITINKVLSSWLHIDLPPVPPVFTLNRHVFIVQLADSSYAALQLANYQDAVGNKCHMTINYRYPY